MALVLELFPGLQQLGLCRISRVNITICKGTKIYITSHFTFLFLYHPEQAEMRGTQTHFTHRCLIYILVLLLIS